jgi:hypothetical protein
MQNCARIYRPSFLENKSKRSSKGYARIQNIMHRVYKSLMPLWFYEQENPLIGMRGPDGKGGRGEGGESEGEKRRGRVGGGE